MARCTAARSDGGAPQGFAIGSLGKADYACWYYMAFRYELKARCENPLRLEGAFDYVSCKMVSRHFSTYGNNYRHRRETDGQH